MSKTRKAWGNLALAITGMVAAVGCLLWYLNTSDEVQLSLARQEVEAVFEASASQGRIAHAKKCLKITEPLSNLDGPIGTTARLFAIGVSPLVDSSRTGLSIPPASEVTELPSEDLLRVSRLLFNTKRFSPADQLVEIVLRRQDEHREKALRLAVTIRFDIGRDNEVLNHCKELLKLHPDDVSAYRVTALVHRNHGRWEHLIDATRHAVDLTEGKDGKLCIGLIEGHIKLGETEAARREVDKLQTAHPGLILRAPVMYADLLLQEGKLDESANILNRWIAQDPGDWEAKLLYGTLLIQNKEFTEAIRLLGEVLAESPAEEKALYQLGQAYARSGDAAKAREYLDRHRAIIDVKVQLYEMEQLAAQQPSNVTVRTELAHTYARIGLMDLADFWTRAAIVAKDK